MSPALPGPEVHCPLVVAVEDPHGRSSLKSIRVCSLTEHNSGRGGDKWLRRERGESDGIGAKAFRFEDWRVVAEREKHPVRGL